jgi:hypothetical protein
MVGYAEDHSPHTYKVFKYVPNGPGETTITRNVRWEHWDHPYKSQSSVIHPQQSSVNQPPVSEQPAFTRVEGLNHQQQVLMSKMIDDYIVENKLCPVEYWTTTTKKTDKKTNKTDNYNLRRKKDNPWTQKKHDPQTQKKGREADNEEEYGFITVSHKKAARRTPPTQARPAASPIRAAATATPQRTTVLNPRVILSPSDEDKDVNDDDEEKENRGFAQVNEEEDYSDEGD